MTISADQKLRQRARQVIPGGMYGHLRSDRLPPRAIRSSSRAARAVTCGT